MRRGADGLEADCYLGNVRVGRGCDEDERGWRREGGIEPLGGIPSTSSLARARAVWASWGRDVRIKEAERGRGRAADSWSSGMGPGWEGGGVVDIVVVGEGDEAGIATCVYQNMRQLVGTVVSP